MKAIGCASILCVESSEPGRRSFESAFADCDCTFACNACEAVRALNERPFDAYVLDYWMPDWSGPLLCREVRKHDPHAPIIFCSEAVNDVNRGRALRAGASAYLGKPIDSQVLTATLAALLTFAHAESLRAANEAESALSEELRRRGVAAATREATAQALAAPRTARSVERTAHSRAYKAFINSGGTRAHFERWWTAAWDALLSPPEPA